MRKILTIAWLSLFAGVLWLCLLPGLRTGSVDDMIRGLEAVMSTLGPVTAMIVGLTLARSRGEL